MQGFVFMSFILISLFNTRFHSHLVSFHFFFFNKKFKKINIMQFHIWPSVVFTDIRLKMRTKNSQANRSLRENVSVFLIAPSCYNKQKCRYERTFKERNRLALIPVFQIYDKKWWPVWTLKFIGEKHKAFEVEVEVGVGVEVGGLWYCSFYRPLGRFQNWVKR